MSSGIILVAILRVIASIICLICAYGLLRDGKDGWGWFLFVGLWLGAITLSGSSK